MLTDIHNFLPISETLATAGQPTAEQFVAICEAGFEVVINLAMPTSTNALPEESAIVTDLDMVYHAIPVVWEKPTKACFQQFQQTLAAHAGQKVFVHCAMNMRVSAFVYLHRCLNGVPHEEALTDLTKIWEPNETWQHFIHSVLADPPGKSKSETGQ